MLRVDAYRHAGCHTCSFVASGSGYGLELLEGLIDLGLRQLAFAGSLQDIRFPSHNLCKKSLPTAELPRWPPSHYMSPEDPITLLGKWVRKRCPFFQKSFWVMTH